MDEFSKQYLRKPEWLRTNLSGTAKSFETQRTISEYSLNTICGSGNCPNRAECERRGVATFMIGGNICTRACRFCATNTGIPLPPDENEPGKLALVIKKMRLRYVVITSVDRDDLKDYGAAHWARCLNAIKQLNPDIKIEVLLPDFMGDKKALEIVLKENPYVAGHNIETVERLTPFVRHRASYERSLEVLSFMANRGFTTKTSIMVGLGEKFEEVEASMKEILRAGVSLLTIGQYLRPSRQHIPVMEYVHPDVFSEYKKLGESMGFSHVESGPLVRSSYMADTYAEKNISLTTMLKNLRKK